MTKLQVTCVQLNRKYSECLNDFLIERIPINQVKQHLYPNTDMPSKDLVHVYIEYIDGVGYTSGKEIHLNVDYFNKYDESNFYKEFMGVLIHEMVHVYQYNALGTAPGGIIEGVADYVRLRSGFAPKHWGILKPTAKWDDGYETTGYFFDWIDREFCIGFVELLNQTCLSSRWNNDIIKDITGVPVEELWNSYKNK
jgi:hypothetical protein